MSEKQTPTLFSRISTKTWNSVVNPDLDKEPKPKEKKRWISSKARKLPLPALVALSLLGFGSILLSLGVGLRYGYSAGFIVFGLICLALGVLIGLDS